MRVSGEQRVSSPRNGMPDTRGMHVALGAAQAAMQTLLAAQNAASGMVPAAGMMPLPQVMEVVVPHGVVEGQQFRAFTPSGFMVVTCPPGAHAGVKVKFSVRSRAAGRTQPGPAGSVSLPAPAPDLTLSALPTPQPGLIPAPLPAPRVWVAPAKGDWIEAYVQAVETAPPIWAMAEVRLRQHVQHIHAHTCWPWAVQRCTRCAHVAMEVTRRYDCGDAF